MQMGARWRVGEIPHRGVPPTLHDSVAALEAQFPYADSWTLTWLEGRPVLDLDAVASVVVSAAGIISTRIHHESGPQDELIPLDAADRFTSQLFTDDDDDDWLAK